MRALRESAARLEAAFQDGGDASKLDVLIGDVDMRLQEIIALLQSLST